MSIILANDHAGPFPGFPDDLCRAPRAHRQRGLPRKIRGRRRLHLQDCQSAQVLVLSDRHWLRAVPTLCWARDARTSGKDRATRGIREDERERRTLVSTLVRSLGLPRPAAEIGEIIAALARAGVFRLRGVLVGTIAYQTYAAMLGLRLPSASTITMDIDIAQFTNVSIAIGDRTAPVLEVLKKVNKSFRPASNVVDGRRATSYSATGGLRVDFLTPDDHTKTGRPRKLPALQTDAQPLHFLDFLIRDPEPAVVLHGAGIYVHVPAPARYAVHKLIISRRRPEGFAKRDKDLHQAEVLLAALAEKRPHDLKSAWEEAYECGPKWRQLMIEGLGLLEPLARDVVLDNIGAPRSILPGIDLSFDNPPARYDFSRDIVTFVGKALGSSVNCAISREALDDHFGSDGLGQEGRLEAFLKNKSRIEAIARAKYLSAPVEEPGSLLIRTTFLTTRFGE
ncbi:GSU2403 family nucleotidyltransferase fold protein [Bradyrhizobium pachyrhizi]